MQLGMVGLGRIGANMVRRLRMNAAFTPGKDTGFALAKLPVSSVAPPEIPLRSP
jgi:hypothetical protein